MKPPEALTVVTGWSPEGWFLYGRRFYETFERHWPKDVKLVVYGEAPPVDHPIPRAEFRLLDSIPGCRDFLMRHMTDLRAHGREVKKSWKPKQIAAGYNFKFDAWKFCRQGFIPWHAAQTCETPLLAWFDADVVTHADVPAGAIAKLLPPGKDIAYLGRGAKHSEIGFQLYRLKRDGQPVPRVMNMLKTFKDLYDDDGVFDLQEWHSAYVFDWTRRLWMTAGQDHNLTPNGYGHVWFQSPLKQWTDHLKGGRKAHGRSKERG